MPQQLIYTSAPRGIVAGRSGHCTVARSATMREALMLHLEKLSYYQHLSLSGGKERPICACRIVDIRGTRYHVLSRIQDAGLDFTNRTNFIAHHLIFTPEEIRQFPTPPVILRDWPGWIKSWTKEPQLFENENWSGLAALAGKTYLPAQTWQQVTGDAVNGFGLLDARSGSAFRADGLENDTVLGLFAESLEVLEVRDSRRDFRTTAWQYTFTTSMQEQDNPADFRWRCIYSDNPTASRFTPPDCRPFETIRAAKWSGEEVALARNGRQPPRFVLEPQDLRVTDGESARFTCKAEGVPVPTYQWFSVDRSDNGQVMAGEVNPELIVKTPPMGVSRYIVQASNGIGEATSRVATLSYEPKPKLARPVVGDPPTGVRKAALYQKSEEQIESNRLRLQAQAAEELYRKRQQRNNLLWKLVALIMVAGGIGGVFAYRKPLIRRFSKTATREDDRVRNIQIQSNSPVLTAGELSITNTFDIATNPVSAAAQNSAKNGVMEDSSHSTPEGWGVLHLGDIAGWDFFCKAKNGYPLFELTAGGKGFGSNDEHLLFAYKLNTPTEFRSIIVASSNEPLFSFQGTRGIMVRESTNVNSPFLFIGTCATNLVVACRDAYNNFTFDPIPALRSTNLFLRLYPSANKMYAAGYSVDGHLFTSASTRGISESEHPLFGFVLASGSASNLVTAHFRDSTAKPIPSQK